MSYEILKKSIESVSVESLRMLLPELLSHIRQVHSSEMARGAREHDIEQEVNPDRPEPPSKIAQRLQQLLDSSEIELTRNSGWANTQKLIHLLLEIDDEYLVGAYTKKLRQHLDNSGLDSTHPDVYADLSDDLEHVQESRSLNRHLQILAGVKS